MLCSERGSVKVRQEFRASAPHGPSRHAEGGLDLVTGQMEGWGVWSITGAGDSRG